VTRTTAKVALRTAVGANHGVYVGDETLAAGEATAMLDLSWLEFG